MVVLLPCYYFTTLCTSKSVISASAIIYYLWRLFFSSRGWLVVSLFIHLFICWSSRTIALLMCYHSIIPCTSEGGISASGIFGGLILVLMYR